MIGRIVITSVPRGLDGGDGVQIVQRTQGLSTPIADRLAQLGSYPHPYDFGDPRNPHVLFHRIERAGGRTIHLLGSVRDAGASYSGRSNHLAEIIAIDDDEIRRLPGGPAYAAGTVRWLAQWQGEPREVPLSEEPVVPARDPVDPAETGRPIRCAAWETATGDAGWAGELAKSFVDGRRALVWVNQSVDAASLFAEAARLLPPSVRWQVEFNTCEIEPFPAHWRAVRQEPEFTVVGPRPSAQDLVLDLDDIRKKGLRAPDHPLAQRARGESAGRAASAGSSAASASATAPGVPPGGLADADTAGEAALRASLRAIREDRQRRSGVTARAGASDAYAPWWDWRVAAAAAVVIPLVCGVIAAVVLVVQDKNRAQELWNRFTKGSTASFAPAAAGGLRSEAESDELARRKEEREQEEERKRVAAEADRRKKAEESRAAKEAEDKKKNDAAAAKLQREGDAQKKVVAEQKQAKQNALDRFLKNDDQMTVRIRPESEASALVVPSDDLRPAEHDLCAFDATNLVDPKCEVWSCVNPKKIKLWVEPDDREKLKVWTVEGQRFDPLAADWVSQSVCRLAVRDGRLWVEWPDKKITSEHALFEAIEKTSLLEISCKDDRAGAKNERIRKWIRLAKPIALSEKPSSNPRFISINPLVQQQIQVEPQELARWIGIIEENKLRWKFGVTPPNRPKVFVEHPNPKATVKLPEKPIAIGYEAVDKATGRLVRVKTGMQVTTTVAFVPSGQAGFRINTTINGLDVVPALKPLFTLPFLNETFRQKNPSHLRDAVAKNLEQSFREQGMIEIYMAAVFSLFLQTVEGGEWSRKCGGVTSYVDLRDKMIRNRAESEALPARGQRNENRPTGGQETITAEKAAFYEAKRQQLHIAYVNCEQMQNALGGFLRQRLLSEADGISRKIAGCEKDPDAPDDTQDADKFCRDDFEPMTLEIISISAVVTPRAKPTADDDDENPSPPTDPPLLIDLIEPRSN